MPIETILLYVSLALTLAIGGYCIYLHRRLSKLLHHESLDLEESIRSIIAELRALDRFRNELEPYLSSVEKRLKKSLTGLHTLRFDPFKGDGSGGKQSFATALVNEAGEGVIISTLHSRDRMSIYSKPVTSFSSAFDLTDEEAHALSKAKESCTL